MSSFHNTPPRTREERLAAANRDSVEKGNLKSRTGGHHKYQEPGNPIIPEPSSPLYAAESNRFQRGVADEIREQKQQETRKHQEMLDRKRQDAIQREQHRFQKMEDQRQTEDAHMQHVREAGLRGKTNKSSEHFNIISLDYHPTAEGDKLKYKDEVAAYKNVLRQQNLFNKSHSVPHNIITGEPRANTVALPPAPSPPR